MHLGLSHPGPSEPIWPTEPAVSLEELDRIASKLDQNLIIWREDSEAIARAAQYLKAFWRSRHPDVAVKQFRGDQRLALLTHINQGIAEIGLNRALQTPSPPRSPSQMVLITHAEQLLSADVQMLQDLAVQLPGLRWRFVLLCIERSGEPTHAALTSLTLLNAQPRWTAVPAAHQPDARALTACLGQAPIMASASASPQALTRSSSGGAAKRLAWSGLVAILALAAWGIWQHFETANPMPSAQVQQPETETAPSSDVSEAVVAALQSPPQPSASAPQPPDTALADTAPSQTETNQASPTAAEPANPTPVSAPQSSQADIPDVALRGVRWLGQLSPDSYVLVHGAFQTTAQAQSLIRSRAELANARMIRRKNSTPGGQFLVITGPFRSQERAQNYKVREKLSPQIQVRRVSDVLLESAEVEPSRP